MTWEPLAVPPDAAAPHPITARAQPIPVRRTFAEHAHRRHQIVYAVSGVLTVAEEGRSLAISAEEAVWLPTGAQHRVGSLLGAAFRSL
ncbi:cupin domain-containing protein [Methylobacterium sp. NEAU 140]|uniref:cupin domain-containing protein n=1 Tax=Methylobacterium sp. NEAU 140 TaxID=3064945 RepID=UPI0027354201|nr:cupin domain-containing protein [Methylobacterium sp. NEAU 140]MDP4024520.1 cupin domain-containing protein [Methylobacterium sp. NEAU 140]